MTLLAELPFFVRTLLLVLFFLASLVLILTILIQKPAGGGLAGAFGSGAGSGQTAFGARTGDALTIATIVMFVVFVLGAIGLNFAVRPDEAVIPSVITTPDGIPVEPSDTPATETPATETPATETPTDPPAGGQPEGNTPTENPASGNPTGGEPVTPEKPADPQPTGGGSGGGGEPLPLIC